MKRRNEGRNELDTWRVRKWLYWKDVEQLELFSAREEWGYGGPEESLCNDHRAQRTVVHSALHESVCVVVLLGPKA